MRRCGLQPAVELLLVRREGADASKVQAILRKPALQRGDWLVQQSALAATSLLDFPLEVADHG